MFRKVGMAALAASSIAALAMATAASAADKPVFGLVMSFSGWFAPVDADTIAGAKLAVEEINANGGVSASRSRWSSSTTSPSRRLGRMVRSR